MAKILIFNNFLQSKEQSILVPKESKHSYNTHTPGIFRANPYSKSKHITLLDACKRSLAMLVCSVRATNYDILILDSVMSGLLASFYLYFFKKVNIVIWSFNVPRRRQGIARTITAFLLKRVDRFIVHGAYDIEYACKQFALDKKKFTFFPFVREQPQIIQGVDSPWGDDKFIISYGGNARDYKTFIEAVKDMPIKVLIIAREYNLTDIEIPPNVKVLFNIPLSHCDTLTSEADFVIFTFDGSEPSCGQISIVTAFMLGKTVIATRCTGTEDYILHENNGLFVKLNDCESVRNALTRLNNDKDLLQTLSSKAKTWADNNLNSNAIQIAVEEITEDLLHNNK